MFLSDPRFVNMVTQFLLAEFKDEYENGGAVEALTITTTQDIRRATGVSLDKLADAVRVGLQEELNSLLGGIEVNVVVEAKSNLYNHPYGDGAENRDSGEITATISPK